MKCFTWHRKASMKFFLKSLVCHFSHIVQLAHRAYIQYSLTTIGGGRKWVKKFPPMPTKRTYTTAVCTGAALIVAGGEGKGDTVLSTVEVIRESPVVHCS